VGYITQVTYRVDFTEDPRFLEPENRQIALWMAHTTLNDFQAPFPWIPQDSFTLVYEGEIDLPTESVNFHEVIIKFPTPFDYKGGNLVLMTRRSFSPGQTFGNSVRWHDTNDIGFRRVTMSRQGFAGNIDISTIGPSTVEFHKPDIRLLIDTNSNVDNPLSVTLSTFSTEITTDRTVMVNWITSSESEVNHFIIARNTYNEYGTARVIMNAITGTNTTNYQRYSFEDPDVIEDMAYYYWLTIRFNDSSILRFGPERIVIDKEETSIMPLVTTISSVFPNPVGVGGSAQFDVSVKEGETAALKIFNIRGQLVREFNDVQSGNSQILWNLRDTNNREISSGVYFYQFSSPSNHTVRRMVVLK